MIKRIFSIILILLICAAVMAPAEDMLEGEYTDVPSVMTQDAVISIEVEQEELGCAITLRQPDFKSMALLEDVYNFVWRDKNRPVRYYDEETQEKIQALVPGVDIDILHMTEFMSQDMEGEPEEPVYIERLFDVEYYPGQLVIVVLGIELENGEYRWFPYRAEVPSMGLITYTIPVEDYMELVGQPVIYHVLTDRIGARGEALVSQEVITDNVVTPSKGSRDIIRIRRWYSESGEPIDDDFSIFIVDKTDPMWVEIQRIGEFVEVEENPAIYWFPEEIVNQASLLLGEDVDLETLIIYDIVAVMSKEYKDTYGDVATENLFASAYSPEHEMVAILGFPIYDAEEKPFFEWYVLRAESVDDIVELVFKQLIIPKMETEPAMLIIFSEPLDEIEEPEEIQPEETGIPEE